MRRGRVRDPRLRLARQSLAVAQTIQQQMLPGSNPRVRGADIAGWSLACDETGGDYYDFLTDNKDGSIGLIVGDVSGHGVGPALLMATARAFIRAITTESKDISEILRRLNVFLERDTDAERFMTLFFGIYEPDVRELTYVSAGHDEPMVYHAATKTWEDLDGSGFPLGMLDDSTYPSRGPFKLEPGDILLVGTDGIWEAMDAKQEKFGKERMHAVVNTCLDKPAEVIIQRVQAAVEKFLGNTPQRDDHTLVVVKVLDPGEQAPGTRPVGRTTEFITPPPGAEPPTGHMRAVDTADIKLPPRQPSPAARPTVPDDERTQMGEPASEPTFEVEDDVEAVEDFDDLGDLDDPVFEEE
jgi:serine phosphatase RsbU (regulator of sigma subunit)